MDSVPKFFNGNLVYRIQDINSVKKGEHIPSHVVHNSFVPTDMKRVGTGESVHFYVDIYSVKDANKGGKYHQQNLVLCEDFDPNETYVGV